MTKKGFKRTIILSFFLAGLIEKGFCILVLPVPPNRNINSSASTQDKPIASDDALTLIEAKIDELIKSIKKDIEVSKPSTQVSLVLMKTIEKA
jgi:hypothetical protein